MRLRGLMYVVAFMIEIFESFEQVAGRLSPVVLLGPGLALVVVGLVAWLAGMCVRQVVLALFGAVVAGLAGFYMTGRNPVAAAVAATGGVAFGIVLPRLFMALFLAAFGMAVAFGVVAKPYFPVWQGAQYGTEALGPAAENFTVGESLRVVQAHALDVSDCIEAAARQLHRRHWVVIAAAGAGLLVLSMYFEWSMGALTCSLLGTALTAGGLTLLLMFKGSAPIAHVRQQGAFYAVVLLGMAAFGTLEQLLVCRPPKGASDGEAGKSETRKGSKQSWRSH
jgi:hypothetical protein